MLPVSYDHDPYVFLHRDTCNMLDRSRSDCAAPAVPKKLVCTKRLLMDTIQSQVPKLVFPTPIRPVEIGAPPRRKLGDTLLEAGVVTAEALNEALALAQRTGIRIGQALIHLRYIDEAQLVAFLSAQQGVPFFRHDLHSFNPDAARLLPEELTRRHHALPITADEHHVTVAMLDPLDASARQQLSAALGRPIIPAITTVRDLEQAFEAVYQDEYTHRSTRGLMTSYPHDSAFRVVTQGQKIALGGLLALVVIGLVLRPIELLIGLNTVATLIYLAFTAHRFWLVIRAFSHGSEVPVSAEEVQALDDRDLPLYTILVPVYREANVLPKLMRAISALDYPETKLDVKLLMEANDAETIAAAQALGLPPWVEQVIVPDSLPKTKPKACNYGLIKARGTYVTIYDAEDLPEPDQLKKVVIAFRKLTDDVACVQAKLNYYNRYQNLLTRWFTTEYSMWFDLILPGLDSIRAPIPLGGTSNHFRRNRLEALGGWDPFNVTEDADLGVRLHKAGYRTAIVDSTTFEEANSDTRNWIRQRSRWVKGYIQTWLVHMRSPLRLWRSLGPRAFVDFNLTVGGTALCLLLNPIYWTLTLVWFLTRWQGIEQLFPPSIYYLGVLNLMLGNFAFMYLCILGALRRGYYDLVTYALLVPAYWLLMSIAAWKGLIQLFTRPFYWEKTIHGLDQHASQAKEAA